MPAPLQVLLAWCLFLPALCGVGFALVRLFPGPPARIELSLSFWLGATGTAALLIAWHLCFPVDGWVWILLGPVAAAGLFLEWRERKGALLRWLGERPIHSLAVAAFAFWLATRAASSNGCPDDGLYYTQTVRWSTLYPAVPGLANLHPLLAFNNAYHLLVAAVGVGPLRFRGDNVANGLLMTAVFAACSSGLFRVLDPRRRATAADLFAALLLGPALDLSVSAELSCPAADFAVYMTGTGLLLSGLRPVLEGAPTETRRLGALIVACAGAVILKQSLVCVALPVVLFAGAHWAVSQRPKAGELHRMAGFAFAAGLVIGVPWIAHGVVLSGYPLFPSPWPELGLSWQMDHEIIAWIYKWVNAFARWPGHSDAEVAASGWAGKWFAREWLNNRAFLLPAVLAGAAGIALAAAVLSGRRSSRNCLAALAPVALGLVIWWVLAPDTRFAGPLLWATADLLALAAASAFWPSLDGRVRVAVAIGALAIAAGAFAAWTPSFVWRREFPELRHNRGHARVRLLSGETVELNDREGCWDPPCGLAPLDPRLRKPGDWRAGFTRAP
jgi:hypothetical protein